MEKFRGKYRISSARLQNWDYGWNAAYFVTICTENRVPYFGEINEKKLQSSEIGNLAEHFWYEIPEHFSYCHLDAFVVMPNHIHGIVMINKIDDTDNRSRDAINRVSTVNRVSTENNPNPHAGGITGHKNPMMHENLSRVIRWYKGRVSFECRKIDPMFAWQSRFHDHIIRDEKSFQKIAEYIENHPALWQDDRFYE